MVLPPPEEDGHKCPSIGAPQPGQLTSCKSTAMIPPYNLNFTGSSGVFPNMLFMSAFVTTPLLRFLM